jgi:putative nucleotidyltransferase with HDIG domain
LISYYLQKVRQYDRYTYLHSKRVAHISVFIGESINLNSVELAELSEAALLHDLGKIQIPLEILNRPSKLLQTERNIIEKHPLLGIEIIDNNHKDELTHVIQGIKSHHEHFDGTGYPLGLSGEEIPLLGRIIAIADAFDAMTSFRVYRSTLTIQEANKQILQAAGSQFDPYIAMKSIGNNSKWLIPQGLLTSSYAICE